MTQDFSFTLLDQHFQDFIWHQFYLTKSPSHLHETLVALLQLKVRWAMLKISQTLIITL